MLVCVRASVAPACVNTRTIGAGGAVKVLLCTTFDEYSSDSSVKNNRQ